MDSDIGIMGDVAQGNSGTTPGYITVEPTSVVNQSGDHDHQFYNQNSTRPDQNYTSNPVNHGDHQLYFRNPLVVDLHFNQQEVGQIPALHEVGQIPAQQEVGQIPAQQEVSLKPAQQEVRQNPAQQEVSQIPAQEVEQTPVQQEVRQTSVQQEFRQSPAKPVKQTVAIRLNTNPDNQVEIEQLKKAGLVVTSTGLKLEKPIPLPEQSETVKQEDEAIHAIAGNVMATNEMIQTPSIKAKVEPAQNDIPIENELDTIVVSNDDTGVIKMTFTENAVGSYETVDEKNGVSRETVAETTDDDDKYLGVSLMGFRALEDKNKKSRNRKSVKPARFTDSENGNISSEVGTSPSKQKGKRKLEIDEEEKGVANKKGKQKGKGGSKKNKLNVDEVYNSGESDGDDLSRDVLKVRMCKCDVCGKHFLDKDKLESHKVAKHGKKKKRPRNADSNKEYTCDVCGHVFRRREHWRRHKIVHSEVSPYKCELCGRGFKRPEHVRRHQSVHTGDKPFQCDMCDKKFTRNEHLQKHIQIHFGKSAYANKKKKSKKSSSKGSKNMKLPVQIDTSYSMGIESSSDTSSVTDSPRKVYPRPRLTVIDY